MSDTDTPEAEDPVTALAAKHGVTIKYRDGGIVNGSIHMDGSPEAVVAFNRDLDLMREQKLNEEFGRASFTGGTVEFIRKTDGQISMEVSRPIVEYVSAYPRSVLDTKSESIEPPRRLVWLDLETTGLDPRRDRILEVAVIITDANLEEISVFHETENEHAYQGALRLMDEKVLKMHTDSGLLEEIKTKPGPQNGNGRDALLAFIKQHVPERGRGLLAGSSVGFDKAFLRENMPEVLDHLHYRIFDVSVIKEACRLWAPELMEPKATHIAHRALADLRASIAEARRYRDTVFSPAREVFFCGSDVEPAEGFEAPEGHSRPGGAER